jgi:signal-transduction protein with cAMP-binding, CBS, and nucleotidyltransferase domain
MIEGKEATMRVSEVMHTPAVVCRPTTTLHEVAQLMDMRDVGSVVIVDDLGYVAGIVTDRDIALRSVGAGHSPDVTVDTIMTRDLATVTPTSDVAAAASIMQKRGVRRVPVVDDMGTPHGVISLDDLVQYVSHEADVLADAVLAQTRHPHPIS